MRKNKQGTNVARAIRKAKRQRALRPRVSRPISRGFRRVGNYGRVEYSIGPVPAGGQPLVENQPYCHRRRLDPPVLSRP